MDRTYSMNAEKRKLHIFGNAVQVMWLIQQC